MTEWLPTGVLAPTLCIFLVSAVLQGASGFGMALIAVPLLTLLMDPKMAVPVTTLASMLASTMIAVRLRQHCDWRRAAWLGIPALLTAPFGVHLLKVLTARQLCAGLGVVLIGSAAMSLWQRWRSRAAAAKPARSPHLHPAGSVAVGGFSGVLGGALGMTGPLLADYLNKSGIRPNEFRITLNLIFLASSVWRMGLYVTEGILTGSTLCLAIMALPAVFAGVRFGGAIGRRIRQESFTTFINWLLLVIGIGMLLQSRR